MLLNLFFRTRQKLHLGFTCCSTYGSWTKLVIPQSERVFCRSNSCKERIEAPLVIGFGENFGQLRYELAPWYYYFRIRFINNLGISSRYIQKATKNNKRPTVTALFNRILRFYLISVVNTTFGHIVKRY